MNYRTANGETEDSVIQEKNNYKIEQEKILDDRMIALKLLKENNQDF